MTETGYARILLDKKDTQIMKLESEITKLRIEYERQIKKLQKENAELKEQLESERDLPTIAYMQGAEKQKKKDAEELKKWKDEWQEQVQKATDEGYARTLQTIQLSKVKELLKRAQSYTENLDDEADELYDEIEQFLSEVEK